MMRIRIRILQTTGPKIRHGSVLSLHAPIVNVHGPPQFQFDFDPDPVLDFDVD